MFGPSAATVWRWIESDKTVKLLGPAQEPYDLSGALEYVEWLAFYASEVKANELNVQADVDGQTVTTAFGGY